MRSKRVRRCRIGRPEPFMTGCLTVGAASGREGSAVVCQASRGDVFAADDRSHKAAFIGS